MITFIVAAFQAVNPHLMDIGPKGRVMSPMGYTDTSTGRGATPDDIAKAADGVRFVFVGESHNNPDHHKAQAAVIEALVKRGRDVCVGLEMFTRDNQASLNGWTLGWWTDEEFQIKSDWKKQWGFPYPLYKPVFDVIKQNGLPMAALNVPRDWVRQVGKNGPSAITPEQKKWVPDLDLGNKTHRSIFDALIGGHPASGADKMYAGMVTWDTGMAQSAMDFMGSSTNKKRVMVIVVGSSHTLYGQGINWRIQRKTGERMVNVACVDSDKPVEVSRGIGDFVFVAPPGKE